MNTAFFVFSEPISPLENSPKIALITDLCATNNTFSLGYSKLILLISEVIRLFEIENFDNCVTLKEGELQPPFSQLFYNTVYFPSNIFRDFSIYFSIFSNDVF